MEPYDLKIWRFGWMEEEPVSLKSCFLSHILLVFKLTFLQLKFMFWGLEPLH